MSTRGDDLARWQSPGSPVCHRHAGDPLLPADMARRASGRPPRGSCRTHRRSPRVADAEVAASQANEPDAGGGIGQSSLGKLKSQLHAYRSLMKQWSMGTGPAPPGSSCKDSVRALGEEAEANHAELEQRGMVAPTQVVAWSLPELHAGRMVARRDRTPGASAERRGRLQEALAWPATAGRVQPRQVLAADLTSPPVPELLACQDPAATDADALLARAEHAYRQDRGWAAPRLPSDSSTTSNWSQQPTRPRPAGPMWGGGGGPADTQA